jgi:AcrR family transcriptional regulator
MALTKGAFYHHFGSVPKFRMALLDWYEQRRTGAVIEAVEAAGSLGPRDRLLRILDEALKDIDDAAGPDLEVAIRAWANQDPRSGFLRDLRLLRGGTVPGTVAVIAGLRGGRSGPGHGATVAVPPTAREPSG